MGSLLLFFAMIGITTAQLIIQGNTMHDYSKQIGPYRASHTPVIPVQAILSGTALLPCDLTPTIQNDSVVLVVWYKKGNPIYSYDTRHRESERGKHWKDVDLFRDRAYFRLVTEPATLAVNNISESDQGEYRCRIDFLKSPTKNSLVHLTVVVPPEKPKIFDDNGKEVVLVAGPYVEGGDMKLTCMVAGGRPEPVVRWWKNGSLIESHNPGSSYNNVRTSELVVRKLSRDDQHASFTCQALNSNISQPVSMTITIEIYFKPLKVELLSSNQPLSADRKYEMQCQSFGSRPPALITWWLDGVQLFNHTQENSNAGNITTSTLFFTPTRLDNEKLLTCRAENPKVTGGVEESSVKLNVFFVPEIRLELGSSLNPDDIEEGDDVYFECKVNANPPAYKVLWKHNGQIIQSNPKTVKRLIISNRDLALQKVSRNQSGNYTCVASNVEGDGVSNSAELKIMFKPICRPNQKIIYGVGRRENAEISCQVDAYPPPESFKWSFNNTAETIEVPQTRFDTGKSTLATSTLKYTPINELDFGTVLCWANNIAGQQIEPCAFQVIAAGKPDPPNNCSITNQSEHSVQIQCIEGFDGGQAQTFIMEVFDDDNKVLQANVSEKVPSFTVQGLEPGKVLKIIVYAANPKGRSDQVLLEGLTLKLAEKQTGTPASITPLVSMLIGIAAACFLVFALLLLVLRCRKRQSSSVRLPHNHVKKIEQKPNISLPVHSELDEPKDDKNPDIIPAKKDSNYHIASTFATPGTTSPGELQDTLPNTPLSMRSFSSPVPYTNGTREKEKRANKNNGILYAELSLGKPTIEIINRPLVSNDAATIYAKIDYGRKATTSPSPANPFCNHREIVTVRTPLMGCQQESCV